MVVKNDDIGSCVVSLCHPMLLLLENDGTFCSPEDLRPILTELWSRLIFLLASMGQYTKGARILQ